MIVKKRDWPEVGDLVIATVSRITDYGAYVTLDEYDREGLLHISEISTSWVRNIRDHVREGQKVVLKVLRVDPRKGHVDLSLKRVTRRERIEKTLLWKKERKAEGLLRSAAEKLGISSEELYEKAGVILEKQFGSFHEGLEAVARDGVNVLLKLGVPEKIAKVLEEIAKEKIRIPMVKIKGTFELRCLKPNGVELIREALLAAKEATDSKEAKVRLYVVSPPKYCIEVLAEDYKIAEHVLQQASEAVLKAITQAGGQGSFEREK